MAYNTPVNYGTDRSVASRTISPSQSGALSNSTYVSPRVYKGFSSNNPNAKNNMLYDADLIKQDIYNHFMTAKGERVMLPDFGSIIWDHLYNPLDEVTKSIVKEDAKQIVSQDPRVALTYCSVVGFEHGIIVNLTLTILPQNMVEQMSIEFNVNGSTGTSSGGGY
jgi:phage baseplate assembly protein W